MRQFPGEEFLQDLTVAIFTKNRRDILIDLISFWEPYAVDILILDGSDNPMTEDELCLHWPTKRIGLVAAPSLWDRYEMCAARVETRYAIWHSDDDFWLPRVLARAIQRNQDKLENRHAIFSTVQGFSLDYVQKKYSASQWSTEYNLIQESFKSRVSKFSENRANRYFYAIWPSDYFRIALLANAKASRAIQHEKLIFADIGFELSGAVLLKLKCYEQNFILKRFGTSVTSADDVVDCPTISQVFNQPDMRETGELWIEVFSREISRLAALREDEVRNSIAEAFRIISEKEIQRRLVDSAKPKSLMNITSNFLNSRTDRRIFAFLQQIGSRIYRKIFLPITAPMYGLFSSGFMRVSKNRDMRRIYTYILRQKKRIRGKMT